MLARVIVNCKWAVCECVYADLFFFRVSFFCSCVRGGHTWHVHSTAERCYDERVQIATVQVQNINLCLVLDSARFAAYPASCAIVSGGIYMYMYIYIL
jgi:hypothetical protein